jgi:hypothetical protein
MIGWKCLPGILYQTEGEGKTKERQKGSVLEAKHCGEREMVSAIK